MKMQIGSYDEDRRFPPPSETARAFIKSMNDERAHANNAADLAQAREEATARNDDLAMTDIDMRSEYADCARDIGAAQRNVERDEAAGRDGIEDARNRLAANEEYLAELKERHEEFRQRAKEEHGRDFNPIEDRQRETVSDRHAEQDAERDATPAASQRQRPGVRRSWDGDRADQQAAYEQRGESFAGRLARMQQDRDGAQAKPGPSLREQFDQLKAPAAGNRAETDTHAALSGAIAQHEAQPDRKLGQAIETTMQGYRDRSMAGPERSQALVDVAAANLRYEQSQEPQARKIDNDDPAHLNGSSRQGVDESHERAVDAWSEREQHASNFHDSAQRFAATQQDSRAERDATPTRDDQGEAYQPRPAGFGRRCDAVDRAAEQQREQAQTQQQQEERRGPRMR